jgi:hypothetical protein
MQMLFRAESIQSVASERYIQFHIIFSFKPCMSAKAFRSIALDIKQYGDTFGLVEVLKEMAMS